VSAHLCSGVYNGHTRIFFASFGTSAGRTLGGGTATSSCVTYGAPSGWQIVGFHGRAAEEVDRLGVVFAPQVAKPGAAATVQLVSQRSGQCLDVTGAAMGDGTGIEQWPCSGGAWQRWSYDATTGLVRSAQDRRFCLDNSGVFGDGAGLVLWRCSGNANQRFTLDPATGAVRVRSHPVQVLDVKDQSTAAGAPVQTWTWWGGSNQRWSPAP
jgi:hypothetical protein